jgi:hypothetical protein
MCKFIVVKSLTRKYGYTLKAPQSITWATGRKTHAAGIASSPTPRNEQTS